MAEDKNKLSNDWVRCQSKSRQNRYYLFNKKTGETNWCSDAKSSIHLKTVSAKDVSQTPAQDRMKRLQNQLEKKRLKEAVADNTKSSRRAKTDEKKDNLESIIIDSKPAKKVTQEEEACKLSLPNELQTPPKKAKKDTNNDAGNLTSSSKSSSVQNRLIIASRKSPEGRRIEKSNAGESIEKIIAYVPPKGNKNKTIPSVHSLPKTKSAQPENKKFDRRNKELEESLQPPGRCPESAQKNIEVSPIEISSSSDDQAEDEYDENKNQRQSEDKSSFLSKIKVFCNKLLNGTTKTSKRKQTDSKNREKLPANSRPLFKHKKLGNKNLLRGISCDIESEIIQNSDLICGHSPERTSKVNHHISLPKESANDRLQRLRTSMQQQQSLQSLPSLNSDLFSDEIASSPNVSDCEPMDWQPITQDFNDTASSPTTFSGISADLSTVSEYNDTVSENIMRLTAAKKRSNEWKRNHFYFVIDTNVFINNPTFVEELTTMKLCDTMGTVMYIPYCVLQELDKLKIRSPSESIRIRTTRAIKLLNKAFEERNPQFQAQTAADESVHLIKVTSPDDSILNCCLQVKRHVDNLLLLTEDVNLQSKAMCNDILVSTKSDLISLH